MELPTEKHWSLILGISAGVVFVMGCIYTTRTPLEMFSVGTVTMLGAIWFELRTK